MANQDTIAWLVNGIHGKQIGWPWYPWNMWSWKLNAIGQAWVQIKILVEFIGVSESGIWVWCVKGLESHLRFLLYRSLVWISLVLFFCALKPNHINQLESPRHGTTINITFTFVKQLLMPSWHFDDKTLIVDHQWILYGPI